MNHQDYIPRTRLFVQSSLAAGVDVPLDDRQAHYLRHVLRMTEGQEVLLFNGRDGEWQAKIVQLGKKGATAVPLSLRQEQRGCPDIRALFAPVKKDALDFMVEKATELGAASLAPVMTERCVVARVNVDRLRMQAIEAAEQSERLDVPDVAEPATLGQILARWPDGRILLAAAETGEALPLERQCRALPAGAPLAVLTGPEGGFSPEEHRMLAACSFVRRVSLGPRILRAETALIAMLSVVQALRGDWEKPRV